LQEETSEAKTFLTQNVSKTVKDDGMHSCTPQLWTTAIKE